MPTKFAVIAVWSDDVAANAHFYRDVLRLEFSPSHGSQPHFQINGIVLTILKGTPAPAQNTDPDRFPLFAFAVDDLEEMVTHLQQHHVALPWGVESDADGRWVMFHDPAGNLIELVQFNK